ncbi:hypothetical protein C5167_048338 [Papaver somniferum]|uniref:Uncharacterized protein n=1 Tax=Papaver somniferum TaxID=3469 RepID=A0A4Y7KJ28_PAPSO|nr:hypothetical protein C5167_048338 [Papaver somniferum]
MAPDIGVSTALAQWRDHLSQSRLLHYKFGEMTYEDYQAIKVAKYEQNEEVHNCNSMSSHMFVEVIEDVCSTDITEVTCTESKTEEIQVIAVSILDLGDKVLFKEGGMIRSYVEPISIYIVDF